MADEFSPEEKLLRLIRGEKKQISKPAAQKPESPPLQPEKTQALKAAKAEPKPVVIASGEFQYFKLINAALIFILAITIGFFSFDIIKSFLKKPTGITAFTGKPIKEPQQQPDSNTTPAEQRETPPFSTYSETIGSRELFRGQRSDGRLETPGAELANEKIKDLTLIGIIAGEKPQAAIEDRKNQKTYFLYKGQSINQMKVEDILEDRVILKFDGERFELTL